MTDICARCRFWEFIKHAKPDGASGECRRHAPMPMQKLLNMIAEFASDAGYATSMAANCEIEKDPYEKLGSILAYDVHEWPRTGASDWCGEFESRAEQAAVNNYHPAWGDRLASAEEWERERGLTDRVPR